MPCYSSTPVIYSTTYPLPCNCCQSSDCSTSLDSKCVYYTAAALPCSGIATGDTVEAAIQKLEEAVCGATGDYSTYNTYCLAPITTQQEFVEAISEGYCTLLTAYNTFVGTTFPAYQASVAADIDAIVNPDITCAAAGVTTADDLYSVLNKYCTAIGDLQDAVDISSVTWNSCFTVVTPPATIAEGFSLLVSQICSVKSSAAVLPVFNNTGSCLPTPGASDSLVDTIDKIKTRLCQTGTFDINALTWSCITKPSSTATDLQAAFQEVLDQINDYIQNKLTFSADFTVSLTNPSDPCEGKTVELTTPVVSTDRLVASNVGDLAPGTLMQKLTAGTNMSLDDTTIPGQVILNALTSDSYKVKADASDTSEDYLINKVAGVSNATDGVDITETYNSVTDKVDLTPSIDWAVFIAKFLTETATDPTLQLQFCTLAAYCNTTTTTTTTTTTSGPITYDYYTADVYECANCGAGSVSTTTVAFPAGTAVTIGKFYLAYFYDGYTYLLTGVAGGGPGLILTDAAFYNDCATGCGV